jgi:hypothetical protein
MPTNSALQQGDNPHEGRNAFEEAKEYYHHPLREKNAKLLDELTLIKQCLRTAGIDPTKLMRGELRANETALITRRTSQRVKEKTSSGALPHIPTELVLQIMEYALVSKDPIADPLSELKKDHLTAQEQHIAKNQVAYGFLSTCHLFNHEGKKVFWGRNTFMFTTAAALRNFASLAIEDRQLVQAVNLRVIARYYDEDKKVTRYMSRKYSQAMKKKTSIRVYHPPAPREFGVQTPGFQSFSWLKLVDFLRALQPPYSPGDTIEKRRPYLLPNLTNMRIDLVNFQGAVDGTGEAMARLHEEAHHNQPSFLHELMITGLPCGPVGSEAATNLMSLLKFDGLFLDGSPAYIEDKKSLVPLKGPKMNEKVFRSNFSILETDEEIKEDHANHHTLHDPNRPPPVVPTASEQPTLNSSMIGSDTIWKHVPASRDSPERHWVEFDRRTGLRMDVVENILEVYFMDMMDDVEDLVFEDMWSDMADMDDEEIDQILSETLVCAKCQKTMCKLHEF